MKLEVPAISMIIPVYNAENYIKQAVDSVLGQTFQDFELILVNDCSTDNTWDLVKRLYGNKQNVILLENDKNSGQEAARNHGMRHARGKYIAFMDDDDAILPDFFEKLFSCAEKLQADVVSCNAFLWSQGAEIPEGLAGQYISEKDVECAAVPEIISENIDVRIDMWAERKIHANIWNKIYRREFLLQNNIWFHKPTDDWPFSFKCLMHAGVYVRTPYQLNIYRNISDSLSRKRDFSNAEEFEKVIKGQLAIVEDIMNYIDDVELVKENPRRIKSIIWPKISLLNTLLIDNYFVGKNNEVFINKSIFNKYFGKYAPFVEYYFFSYFKLKSYLKKK